LEEVMAGGVKRGEAGAGYPYIPLKDVAEMARVIEVRGGKCRFDELAVALNQTKTSGAFRGRCSAGRQFGVVQTDGSELVLTDLGRRMASRDTEADALAEAFLKVSLYESLYARYAAEGGRLPPEAVIEADIARLGVSPQWAARARRVFIRSAETAGYFRSGRDRLIRPSVAADGTIKPEDAGSPRPQKPSRTSHAEAVPVSKHPLISGLVDQLPPADEGLSERELKRWLNTAEAVMRLIYAIDEGAPAPQPDANLNGAASVPVQPS
jgi:hypothetical protein